MKNTFYSDFDFERVAKSKRTNDYRSPFQIDRDRVIHSSEFRRLQGKTQVFLPGEYDYYRTRLTHSIEVAQIGRSICNYLEHQENSLLNNEFHISSDLVESACLAHDLGNPPFGHAGERTINKLMKDYGGFEGNAQTLRLLTEIFYRDKDDRKGMNPTRALVDGVLKYKSFYNQLDNPLNHFIYDEQKEYIDFVFNGNDIPNKLTPGDGENSINNFKSIECQIMDWADDTAYAINDLVDSVSGGFLTIAKLRTWEEENKNTFTEYQQEVFDEVIDAIKSGNFKARFGSQIGKCIESCKLEETENFMSELTNRYKYNLVIDEKIKQKVKMFKRLSIELVFRSAQLHQMEFKGNSMIKKVFDVLVENYVTETSNIKLLADFSDKLLRNEEDEKKRVRIICDYISGMTDAFAVRTYRRLFDPDFSSLIDFV
ncbi:MAG: dNTP triphosphohydrolase [Melioribacteraceae bacterium]|nr:dNTP triphosphohydrolase [Melioribacteraceae bacterium]